MKVLLIHNYYQSSYQSSSPSGEDVVFKNEIELLKKNHISVTTYTRHNDEILNFGAFEKLKLPFVNIWSGRTYKEIKELIKKEKPNIAHFHNIWYLISPSVYYACKEVGVPVVQTLHNFRLFCANGLLMRNGKVCEECITSETGDGSKVVGGRVKILKNAIKYECYRNSRVFTLPISVGEYFHWIIGTWINKVDAYIALTNFGRNKFIEAGLPADKVFVKPNFLANPPEPSYTNGGYAVFIGRLSKEKGVHVAIDAIKALSLLDSCDLMLKVIGDGPLRRDLTESVKMLGVTRYVEFVGRKSFDDCIKLLKNARFLVMPSVCYEGFPLVVRESFACGKPVIASNLGSLAELVEDGKTGLLFEPGNSRDLAKKIKWMVENDDACIEMGKNARKVFEEKYTAERNFKILMSIYEKVL
jgi:glycosyltransferase involved in cell wall biosynthesis